MNPARVWPQDRRRRFVSSSDKKVSLCGIERLILWAHRLAGGALFVGYMLVMITRVVSKIADWPLRYPKPIVAVSALLVVIAAGFVPRLHISTDRNLLAGKENPYFQHREKVNRLFGTSLAAIVVMEGPDRAALEQSVEQLATRLRTHEDMVDDVFYKVDADLFERHALLYMSEAEVEELLADLRGQLPGLALIRESDALPGLLQGIARALGEGPTAPADTREEKLRLLTALLGDIAEWFSDAGGDRLSFIDALAGSRRAAPSLEDRYLTEDDGERPHLRILFVQPTSTSQSIEAVAPLTDLVRREAAVATGDAPGLRAWVTGMPATITDEMNAVTRDSIVAGVAAGLAVLLIFIAAFRSIRVALFVIIPLGAGLVLSAGLTAILFGHLTLITAYFTAVLFGLGVDFSIHVVARFHEALLVGEAKPNAVRTAIVHSGPAVVVGGGTTMVAFLAIGLSDFRGFAEMGIISGSGVFIILMANLLLLPAALLLWHPGRPVVRPTPRRRRRGAWSPFAWPRWPVIALLVAGTAAGGAAAFHVRFDYAVESLLPSHAESVVGLQVLDKRTAFSMSYAIALAGSVEEAAELRRRFLALPTVDKAEAVSTFIPEDQSARIALLIAAEGTVSEILRTERALSMRSERPSDGTADALSRALAALGAGLSRQLPRRGEVEVSRGASPELGRLQDRLAEARRALAASPDKDRRAAALERAAFQQLHHRLERLAGLLSETGLNLAELPEGIKNRYMSKDGEHFAVIVFPNGDIGNRQYLERHVSGLLSVSRETTGHPVTHLAFTRMVHKGFRDALFLSGAAVLLLVLLDLRNWQSVLLALSPVVVGISLTLCFMWVVDLRFNYANLIALPILIGTGVDYGAHLAHRAMQEQSVQRAVQTTGRAIALTGLTTLMGFGALMLGQHWGVKSLGIILTLGIAFSLFTALVAIPVATRDSKRHMA